MDQADSHEEPHDEVPHEKDEGSNGQEGQEEQEGQDEQEGQEVQDGRDGQGGTTETLESKPPFSTSGVERHEEQGSKSNDVVNLVVLGMGYAGSMVVRQLEDKLKEMDQETLSKVKLIVVDRHEMVWLKISALRAAIAGDEWVNRTYVPIKDIVQHGEFICGRVESVTDDKQVVTVTKLQTTGEGGASEEAGKIEIPYDVLLACTGTMNSSMGDLPEHISSPQHASFHLQSINNAVAKAKNVVVIGGGPCAVEIAGEIRNLYKDKQITIVCSASDLLASSVARPSGRFLRKARKRLAANNIRLIRRYRVTSPDSAEFGSQRFLEGEREVICESTSSSPMSTSKAKSKKNELKLNADLVLFAASWSLQSDHFPDTWRSEVGEILVDKHFLVQGTSNVFAFGDIARLYETKQAAALVPKTHIIVANILKVVTALISGKVPEEVEDLQEWKVSNLPVMQLPMGPNDGVSVSPKGWTKGSKYTSEAKGADLYTNMFQSMLRANPESS